MANFTETTNYSFKKPTVGADTDQWGTHLNETIDGVDSQLKTLADSITSQQLEQLGNVVNVTPVDDQFLRYNGTNWTAETVTIPDVLNDLSNVSGTPSSGDVLTYNGSAWGPASVTSAAVTDGSVTNAKLHPSLQTVIGRILVTDDDDSPTDNQILVYNTSDAEWKYADQAGSTLQTLTDVNTTGLSDGDLMKYDGTAGEFVFIDATAARTLLNVDVSGTDNSTPVTLNTTSHDYLTLSSQQITLGPIVLTDDVSGTLPIANGGTSATTAASARTALGLSIGTNIQAYDAGLQSISGLTTAADKMLYTTASDTYAVADLTAAGRAILDDADTTAQRTTLGLGTLATQDTVTESQISDLGSYITASSTDTLTNKSGDISQWTNDAGYLTAETNNLSTVSGTLGTANGGTGLTAIGTANQVLGVNSGATALEFQTISITESQISDLQSYLTAEVNDLTSAVTWSNVPNANITQGSVTQHQAALSITESQISDLQTYLTASSTATLTNKSGNISQWTNDSGYLTAETNNLSTVSGTLGTANGGTGLTAIGTAGQVLKVNSGATALEFADETGGGGLSDGDKGDITVSSSGGTWTIDNAAVSYAKIQNVSATDKILGRSTAGAGSVEEITCTSAGRALLDDVDASAQRDTLGLGSIATQGSNNVSVTGGTISNATLDTSVTFPAGTVLQVVQSSNNASDNTTSLDFEDITNFSVDITPASSSNKIFIIATGYAYNNLVSATNVQADHRLVRVNTPSDSVLVSTTVLSAESGGGGLQIKGSLAISYLETLSFWTSGSLTYKVQHKTNNTSSTASLAKGRITVMEIQG